MNRFLRKVLESPKDESERCEPEMLVRNENRNKHVMFSQYRDLTIRSPYYPWSLETLLCQTEIWVIDSVYANGSSIYQRWWFIKIR